jgi:hypothetical protein
MEDFGRQEGISEDGETTNIRRSIAKARRRERNEENWAEIKTKIKAKKKR